MPAKRSAQTQPSAEDERLIQVSEDTTDSAVVAHKQVAPDDAPADGHKQQKRKQKKRRKSKLPPPHQQRMVQALGRIEGCILPVGNGIEIATKDKATFPVVSIGKPGLALRLLGLSDSQRWGRFAFWPAFYKEGIILVSFNNADEWEPQEDSPPVDQMFVCGTLQVIEEKHFSVLVGYGYKQHERVDRLLAIESAPLPEWTVGQWVDIVLHRQGEDWRWRGEFHPRGPRVGDSFKSWLPYKEAAVSDVQVTDDLKT